MKDLLDQMDEMHEEAMRTKDTVRKDELLAAVNRMQIDFDRALTVAVESQLTGILD